MSVIYSSYIDMNRKYTFPTLAGGGTFTADTVATTLTGTETPGMGAANAQLWDNFNRWEATATGASAFVEYVMSIPFGTTDIGSPVTRWAGKYNAVGIWMPDLDSYTNMFSDNNMLRIEVRINSTDPGSSAAWTALPPSALQTDQPDPETEGNNTDFTQIGSSRFILIKLDSGTTATANPFINIRFVPDNTAPIIISAGKICILNMESMYTDLDQPVKDGVGYEWQDRDFINKTYAGGIKRGSRDAKRILSMSTFWAGNQWGMEPMRRNMVKDIEPYIISVDYENNLSSIGQHIHTFPVHRMGGLKMKLKSQFSKTEFLGADAGQKWGEWL